MESEIVEGLTVIIPTFNRPTILAGTLDYLRDNLKYDGEICFLIGDDSDYNIKPLNSTLNIMPKITVIPGPKKGLGANLNMLIQAVETDLILQMDDDHHLVKPLDINQFAKDLRDPKYNIGWTRLFIGTEEDLNNDDPFYQFSARMVRRYWVLMPEFELYLASNRPHLKRRDFHKHVGMYREDLKLGETEMEFCHRYIDWMTERETNMYANDFRYPWVVIPVAAPSFDTWEHAGSSWQGTEYDRV